MEPRIPFPTGRKSHGDSALGYPDQARPCDGHPCLIHDRECVWCGRLPGAVIAATWAARERVVAYA